MSSENYIQKRINPHFVFYITFADENSVEMGEKKRLLYIDCLRGFSMIFVVYQHILTFSMTGLEASWFADIVRSFRMPLFFFISGFVSYKALFEWNFKNLGKIQLKKIRGQLLPTAVFFTLFISLHDKLYIGWLFDCTKSGYWFTFVSFEIFLTYCIINMLFSKVKNKNIVLIVLAISAIGISSIWYRLGNFTTRIGLLLSLDYYTRYYIYFIVGIIVKSKIDVFHKLVENKYVTTCMFFLAFVLPYLWTGYNWKIIALTRLWCIYALFYGAKDFFEEKNILAKGLSTIGTHTLEIYLLHFFLLFRTPHISNFLKSLIGDHCFYGPSAEWLLEIVFVGTISVFICFVCVAIKKIIATAFPIVSELCFGPVKKDLANRK